MNAVAFGSGLTGFIEHHQCYASLLSIARELLLSAPHFFFKAAIRRLIVFSIYAQVILARDRVWCVMCVFVPGAVSQAFRAV